MAQELSQAAATSRRRSREALFFLFWAVVFGVAYTQAPLYYSNQNQYFLHGLAAAGRGFLDQDWLANTRDPTPIFSAGVTLTYRYLSENLFHLYYVLLQGLYFYSLVGIFSVLTGIRPGSLAGLCFMAVFVVVHAGLLRLISVCTTGSEQTTGVDYPWFFQCGLAGQYILGFGLQPSVFGVFLVASIHAFLRGRPWQAAVWASASAVLHGTYLLGAAMLMLAYMLLLVRAGSVRRALGVGLLSLTIVAPVLIYNYLCFAPSDRAAFTKAQEILAHFRLPHHAVVERWLDGIALAQIGWMIAALVLVRRTPLFTIMLVVFGLSLLLTLVQVVTGNDSLAVLFPWRTSSILVPLATTVILARLVSRLEPWLLRRSVVQDRAVRAVCGLAIGAATVGGAAIMYFGLGYPSNVDELPLLDFVRSHKQSGDTFLLPVSLPKSDSGARGAFSTNFTPAPRPGTHLIAIDLQRFRIYTGAPIYADFKSIPYQDVEVIEWQRRLLWSQDLYGDRGETKENRLAELKIRGISHVIAAKNGAIAWPELEKVYEDSSYTLYRLKR
jgi:hypothetical protein